MEEYLEALWLCEDKGERPARISRVSKMLRISPPSVVGMLKNLEGKGYVEYLPRRGILLTAKGEEIGRRMVRNGMLLEVFMREKLNIRVDERLACGVEHHITTEFVDALCKMLNHPKACPHGNLIPPGECCKVAQQPS